MRVIVHPHKSDFAFESVEKPKSIYRNSSIDDLIRSFLPHRFLFGLSWVVKDQKRKKKRKKMIYDDDFGFCWFGRYGTSFSSLCVSHAFLSLFINFFFFGVLLHFKSICSRSFIIIIIIIIIIILYFIRSVGTRGWLCRQPCCVARKNQQRYVFGIPGLFRSRSPKRSFCSDQGIQNCCKFCDFHCWGIESPCSTSTLVCLADR